MSEYYTAMICLNGHMVTPFLERREPPYPNHCPQCGEPTMTECEHCHSQLRGKRRDPGIPATDPEKCCPTCGKPYPWTASATESLLAMIAEWDDLPDELRSQATESVPDLIVDTPKSRLAVLRFKKVMTYGGDVMTDGFKKVISAIGTEAIKDAFGLQ